MMRGCFSHDGEERTEQAGNAVAAVEPPACHIGDACIINGRCGFNHQSVSTRRRVGKLEHECMFNIHK